MRCDVIVGLIIIIIHAVSRRRQSASATHMLVGRYENE